MLRTERDGRRAARRPPRRPPGKADRPRPAEPAGPRADRQGPAGGPWRTARDPPGRLGSQPGADRGRPGTWHPARAEGQAVQPRRNRARGSFGGGREPGRIRTGAAEGVRVDSAAPEDRPRPGATARAPRPAPSGPRPDHRGQGIAAGRPRGPPPPRGTGRPPPPDGTYCVDRIERPAGPRQVLGCTASGPAGGSIRSGPGAPLHGAMPRQVRPQGEGPRAALPGRGAPPSRVATPDPGAPAARRAITPVSRPNGRTGGRKRDARARRRRFPRARPSPELPTRLRRRARRTPDRRADGAGRASPATTPRGPGEVVTRPDRQWPPRRGGASAGSGEGEPRASLSSTAGPPSGCCRPGWYTGPPVEVSASLFTARDAPPASPRRTGRRPARRPGRFARRQPRAHGEKPSGRRKRRDRTGEDYSRVPQVEHAGARSGPNRASGLNPARRLQKGGRCRLPASAEPIGEPATRQDRRRRRTAPDEPGHLAGGQRRWNRAPDRQIQAGSSRAAQDTPRGWHPWEGLGSPSHATAAQERPGAGQRDARTPQPRQQLASTARPGSPASSAAGSIRARPAFLRPPGAAKNFFSSRGALHRSARTPGFRSQGVISRKRRKDPD